MAPRTEPTTAPSHAAESMYPSNEKLRIEDVYKVYGRDEAKAVQMLREGADRRDVQAATKCTVALSGVNASIEQGRVTCIMGLSGSGKSTLVRHLNRLIDPSAGRILLDGRNILELDMPALRELRRRHISMVFQAFGLMPHLNVLDNAAFGLLVRGEPRSQARRVATEWLERVGLEDYAAHFPDELSGGMRQRVGLARALATDAEVLLMDEAFSALDPLIRFDMQDQLIELQQRLQKTIVFITHDIQEALRLGDHIIILRDGRVEQMGTPKEIRERPINEYVQRFVIERDK